MMLPNCDQGYECCGKKGMHSGSRMMAHKLIIRIPFITGCILLISCSAKITEEREPAEGMAMKKRYPGKVRIMSPAQRRLVVVSNPRRKGAKEYIFPDGHREADVNNIVADAKKAQMLIRYNVALIQLVRLNDGRIVSPVMVVKYPRFGKNRRVYMRDAWSVEQQFVSPNNTPEDGWADFAVSDMIQKYILLLKSSDEETGWRVLELKPEKITKVEKVHIPDLMTLTPLEKHPEGKRLWQLHLAAEKEEDKLNTLE